MIHDEIIENMRQDLAELKKILELAQRPKIKDFLTIEIRRQETKLADLIEKEDVSKKDEKIPKTIVAQTKTYDYVIRNYSWDQSDKFVKIYFTSLDGAKEVDASNFELNLTGNKLFFKISNLKGKNWMFEIKELSSNIDHEKSYYKAKSDMVVLFLCKKDQGAKWSHLKKSEKVQSEKPAFAPDPEDSNDDPSAGLMKMMKKMYEEGDDQTKQTIAKAWYEQGNNKRNPADIMGGMPDLGGMDL